jgi:heme-degrading monooxygenase HmoA
MARYCCLWEFQVHLEWQAEFEGRYGAGGAWVALFLQAPGYIETLLLQDRSQNLRYVTIDRWESLEAYRAFRSQFSRQYEELDRLCQGLTTHEALLGEFSN